MSTTRAIFHQEGSHTIELILSIVGALGGAARYVHETIQNNRPFNFLVMLAKAFVSWFVGTSAGHLALSWEVDYNTMFFIVAIFGWLGADGAEILIKWLKQRFFPPAK